MTERSRSEKKDPNPTMRVQIYRLMSEAEVRPAPIEQQQLI